MGARRRGSVGTGPFVVCGLLSPLLGAFVEIRHLIYNWSTSLLTDNKRIGIRKSLHSRGCVVPGTVLRHIGQSPRGSKVQSHGRATLNPLNHLNLLIPLIPRLQNPLPTLPALASESEINATTPNR